MSKAADVCLVLEGTYPFVSGGVSSWVHHLATHMPEITFTLSGSPTEQTSVTAEMYSSDSSLMWQSPSLPGMISTNAPKSLTLVTRPS